MGLAKRLHLVKKLFLTSQISLSKGFHLGEEVLLSLLVVSSQVLDLIEMVTLLISYPVVELLELGDEAVFLLLELLSVTVVLLAELASVLVGQRRDLADEVVLLLLERVCLASLVVLELPGEA